MFAIRNFKFLGFAFGRNGKGIYARVHPKSWKKFKSRLKELGHDITAAGLSSHEYVATGNSTKAGIAGSDNTESSEDSAISDMILGICPEPFVSVLQM